ncbi:methylmalonyl-CoA mutase family protein [Streptomyces sp. NPDC007875]|uniref:methylmalonyl-CoA mutase family protein n=1 Tax=Streptomyces sp. NPDC007875 TaxID=3364783 RepID=UPI0036BC2A97
MDSVARSESDLPIQPLYDGWALAGFDADAELGAPGQFPFTRGVHPTMHMGRPWTMRRYTGFGPAKEPDKRYHELVRAGTGPPERGLRACRRGGATRRRARRRVLTRRRPRLRGSLPSTPEALPWPLRTACHADPRYRAVRSGPRRPDAKTSGYRQAPDCPPRLTRRPPRRTVHRRRWPSGSHQGKHTCLCPPRAESPTGSPRRESHGECPRRADRHRHSYHRGQARGSPAPRPGSDTRRLGTRRREAARQGQTDGS